jgi:hypothetical protein
MNWWTGLALGLAVIAASWALLVLLASRPPDGTLKDLAAFLPACATDSTRPAYRSEGAAARQARRRPGPHLGAIAHRPGARVPPHRTAR